MELGGSGISGSGATLTAEKPVGTIDGSNTLFTVLHAPLFVNIDGLIKENGAGYTYAAGTITTDSLNPPVTLITSYYNA